MRPTLVFTARDAMAMHKLMRGAIAEFVAMLLFVFIGAGSACGVAGTEGWVLQERSFNLGESSRPRR